MLRPLLATLSIGLFACSREAPAPINPTPPTATPSTTGKAGGAAVPHSHEAHAAPTAEPKVERGPWYPPSRDEAAKPNPLGGSAQVLAAGKTLYARECAHCHGDEGRGDGPEAARLRTKMVDLNGEAVSHQGDGTVRWRIASGRGEMPAFAERLTDKELWQLVAFLRSRAPRQ